MKLVFKSDEFAELNYERAYAEGYHVEEVGQIRETISEVDFKGIRSSVHKVYCPGIILSMITSSLERDLVHILESDFPYLQMHFELTTTGCLYHPHANFDVDAEIYRGTHCLLFYPGLQGKLSYLKKPKSYSVEIELSIEFLRRIFNGDLAVLGEFGENIEKNLPAIMGNRSFPITAGMRQILDQIKDCVYTGTLKRLFTEAKVIELLTLQISQISSFEPGKKSLKKRDVDQLLHVQDLLLKNIYTPFTMEELSKIAGVNRTKLQEGFKTLFGTTVFGYITDQRLEEARIKILEGGQHMTIAEIATLSGYKNPQHFTVAFKRKFGVLPRELKREGAS